MRQKNRHGKPASHRKKVGESHQWPSFLSFFIEMSEDNHHVCKERERFIGRKEKRAQDIGTGGSKEVGRFAKKWGLCKNERA